MGEALWDVLPEGKKLGGAPANFAYHVSQFGLDSCVVSAVGDDPLGHEIIDNFTSKGLNQHIAEVPYPTGTVQVEIDPAGIPQYDIKENVAWDNIPFTESLEAIARETRAVCFGSRAPRPGGWRGPRPGPPGGGGPAPLGGAQKRGRPTTRPPPPNASARNQ